MNEVSEPRAEVAVPEGQQRIDIGELLQAIRVAYEKMSNRNSHKGLLVTCGSLIIHLVEENVRLKGLLQTTLVEQVAAEPTVTLV